VLYGLLVLQIILVLMKLVYQSLLAAILTANKWARDREVDQLIWVKKSIVEFMNELKS